MKYTVKPGDTLSKIVLDQGMCMLVGSDWSECLTVAAKVAGKNSIPWSGPPNWTAPISVGQIIDLNDAEAAPEVIADTIVASSGVNKPVVILGLIGGLGVVLYSLIGRRSAKSVNGLRGIDKNGGKDWILSTVINGRWDTQTIGDEKKARSLAKRCKLNKDCQYVSIKSQQRAEHGKPGANVKTILSWERK